MDMYRLIICLWMAVLSSGSPAIVDRLQQLESTTHAERSAEEKVISTPTFTYISNENGEIDRCLYDTPTECERFYEASGRVSFMVVYGEYLYVSTALGEILRCELSGINSCAVHYKGNSWISSMTVGKGFIFAAQHNGNILRCKLDQADSCSVLHDLGIKIVSVLIHDDFIYVGTGTKEKKMKRCSLRTNVCEAIYSMTDVIAEFAVVNDSIISLTWDNNLWNCTDKPDDTIPFCEKTVLPESNMFPKSMTYFNGHFYVVRNEIIQKCELRPALACSDYVSSIGASAIAFSYGTYAMKTRFKKEDKSCSWQNNSKCPPFIVYYNVGDRSPFEVHVKAGKLYNYNGVLVDTAEASQGRSGSAAIFVMGPDGRLLLSNTHFDNLLHTSSLLAGNPVSGAGEMIVVEGIIKEMRSCSEHYPDLKSNDQVVRSLVSQGYKEDIALRRCDETFLY